MDRAAIAGISRLALVAVALSTAGHLRAQPAPQGTPQIPQPAPGRGIELGLLYGRASGSTTFPKPITQTQLDFSSAQQTWGLHFGITVPDLLARNLGVTVRAAYSNGTATHTHPNTELLAVMESSPDPVIVEVQTDQVFEIRSWRLEVEALARYSPTANFSLLAGGAIGSLQVTDWSQSQKLISPSTGRLINSDTVHYTLEDDGRTLVLARGDVLPGENHLSLAAIIGASYALRPVRGFSITPELRLRYDAIEPGIVGAWRPLSIEGKISIGLNEIAPELTGDRHPIQPPSPVNTPRNDETPREQQRPEAPRATITLYSTDEHGAPRRSASVHVIETLRSRTVELPGMIPFETGSAEPPRWLALGPGIRVDSAARLDPAAAAGHLLSAVAARLAESRSAVVVLRGFAAAGEPAGLGGRRVAAIRRALIDGFGCRAEQIVAAGEPARSDSATAGVLMEQRGSAAPFTLRADWIERSYGTSPIKAEPTIEGPGEPRRWSIELRQGSMLVARRTSDDTTGRLDLDVLFRNLSSQSAPTPLSAELTVEDSSGAITSAHAELPFELSGRRDTLGVASYVLLGTDPVADAGPIPSRLAASLRRIASRTSPRSTITIRPLSAGAGDVGERLALRSAETLRGLLGPDARISVTPARPVGRSDGLRSPAPEPALESGLEIEVTAPRAPSTGRP